METKFLDIVEVKNEKGKTLLGIVLRVNTIKERNSEERMLDSIEALFSDGTYRRKENGEFSRTGRHINVQDVLNLIR